MGLSQRLLRFNFLWGQIFVGSMIGFSPMHFLELTFWILLALLVYVYAGYPLLVVLLSKLFGRGVQKGLYEPSVSILIAAYNEAAHIGKTIQNKLELAYPADKLEVIVISDGSTDETDEIVKRYSGRGVKLLRQEPRNGKTAALNCAVPGARGEILVFSDANSMYEKTALGHLVQNFNDPGIGYVTGKMLYMNPDGTLLGEGCSSYMKYENFIRKYETELGSVVGVDGGIDAVRKVLYQTMKPDQLPDFVLPLKVIEQGYRVVYEPEAILQEEALTSSRDEYRMRTRVSLRSLWALREMKRLLNVFRYGLFSMELFSHKVLRYLAFVFLILLYLINAALWMHGLVFRALLVLQTLFYLTSLLGYQNDRRGRHYRYISLPYYFFLVNLAAGHAFVKFLRGTKQVIWTPRVG